jgi:iron complex outermembrane receptor protein
MKRNLFILFALNFSWSVAFAQTGTITGKVVDEDSGEPLTGANVLIKDTSKGTVTDIDGRFIIDDILAGPTTIVVSFIGFESKEVNLRVKEGETVNLGDIRLGAGAIGLKEVQVIASFAEERKPLWRYLLLMQDI